MPADLTEWIELYIDDMLDAQQRSLLEARLSTDAALRSQVEDLRAMDAAIGASLRERFAPQAVPLATPAPLAMVPKPKPAPSLMQRIGWLRIAAAILLAGAAMLVFSLRNQYATPLMSPQQAYGNIVSAGFRPYVVCTDDAEFIAYTQRVLGVGLRVKTFPGLALIGWNTDGDVFSQDTDALLATVDGSQIIVFMDKQSNKRPLPTPPAGLNIFQRDIAGLTLVEVTPLNKSTILDNFEKP